MLIATALQAPDLPQMMDIAGPIEAVKWCKESTTPVDALGVDNNVNDQHEHTALIWDWSTNTYYNLYIE